MNSDCLVKTFNEDILASSFCPSKINYGVLSLNGTETMLFFVDKFNGDESSL